MVELRENGPFLIRKLNCVFNEAVMASGRAGKKNSGFFTADPGFESQRAEKAAREGNPLTLRADLNPFLNNGNRPIDRHHHDEDVRPLDRESQG